MKAFRDTDGFLASHGVHDQQGFHRRDLFLDPLQFGHEFAINLEAACGVQQYDGVSLLLGMRYGMTGNGGGPGPIPLAEYRHIDLGPEGLQLRNGGRTLHIGRHQEG